MKKRILLLIILIIFLLNLITFGLIINFLNPLGSTEKSQIIALIIFSGNLFMTIASFLTLFIYFFKRIYNRGEVFVSHVFSSMRQGALIGAYSVSLLHFYRMEVLTIQTAGLLAVALIFIELFFQNFED
ncbi:MAG: hypothetical protein N4A38_04125 [Candidatus Gracilibacteria bacterium]|nr:hypothetical protein [Candidatus Gracilibacteria bacterium]